VTAPDVDSLATYGGGLNDYSPVIDATTDRPAAGANASYASTAMMSHVAPRCAVRFSPQGSGTPILAAAGAQWDAQWGLATPTPPVLARTGTGVYTITYPATVADEIPVGAAGYNASGHSTSLRFCWINLEYGATTPYILKAVVTAPNVITVSIYNTSFVATDPNDGTVIGIFAI